MDNGQLRLVSAIALNALFGSEPRTAARIVETFGSAEAVFSLSDKERAELFGPYGKFTAISWHRALDAAGEEYLRLSGLGIGFVSIFDTLAYPPLLRECPDAPLLLYVRGDPSILRNPHPVSVVGTRDMDSYGRDWCVKAVRSLPETSRRPTTVSGLAFGVDITAHLASISCGIPTVAVIPVGIDSIYPKSHAIAAEKIISAGGAIITDYPPGTEPRPYNFLRRNRIIAGISAATFLVESRLKGGGMMTARLAFNYGRPVLALPGRIDDPRSAGCNALIAEKVAEPFISPRTLAEAAGLGRPAGSRKADIGEELRRRLSDLSDSADPHTAMKILSLVREQRGISVSELSSRLSLSYSETSRTVCLLESEGFICTDVLQRCSINVNFA